MLRKTTLLITCLSISLNLLAQQKTQVDVYSLSDFPEPTNSGKIELKAYTNYVVHGSINLGESYIEMNGGALTGVDPQKDGITSKVPGPIVRSKRKMVYLDKLQIIVGSDQGSGFLFEDPSQKRYCNLFNGVSVLDAPGVSSKGVGTISGFNVISIELNYYNTEDGLKIGGNINKFLSTINYFVGLNRGIGIEFLDGTNIGEVIIKDNYIVAEKNRSNVGVKVNSGANIGRGRMNNCLFGDIEMPLKGITSYTPGWEMRANGKGIPDTRVEATLFMTGNTKATEFSEENQFKRIRGNTQSKTQNKLKLEGNNKVVYVGEKKQSIVLKGKVRGNSTNYSGSYTIGFKVNGTELIQPTTSIRGVSQGDPFRLSVRSETTIEQGDQISLYVKSNNNPKLKSLIIDEYTIRMSD